MTMVERYIPVGLRRLMLARAAGRCKYCLIPQDDRLDAFHIDHVIAEKHGGPTTAPNLALACPECNEIKGTDAGSVAWVFDAAGEIDWDRSLLIRFFSPRRDRWADHFAIVLDPNGAPRIEPLSSIGRVTVRVFDLNSPIRLKEWQALAAVGLYPPPAG
jgi:hypothetical protein